MFLAADAGRLFGLDMQLLFGMVFQAISILLLFVALTYILYEPVRKVLEDRKQRIANDVASAKQDKAEANEYKAEYEAKLKNIDKEADIILAEPGATVGFAGARVIEQTTKKALPEGFQKSEFVLEHGFIDSIVPRSNQKKYLTEILKMHEGRAI